jgi:hypothetical protein
MIDQQTKNPQLAKAATGIDGLDAITEGGLPAGRPTARDDRELVPISRIALRGRKKARHLSYDREPRNPI